MNLSKTTKRVKKPKDDSNAWFGLGAGTGGLGIFGYLSASHICPVCLIVTPIFFACGAYKKMKYKLLKKAGTGEGNDMQKNNSEITK